MTATFSTPLSALIGALSVALLAGCDGRAEAQNAALRAELARVQAERDELARSVAGMQSETSARVACEEALEGLRDTLRGQADAAEKLAAEAEAQRARIDRLTQQLEAAQAPAPQEPQPPPSAPDVSRLEELTAVLYARGDYGMAYSLAVEAAELGPVTPVTLHRLGYCALQLGHVEEAVRYCRDCCALLQERPDAATTLLPGALTNLGVALERAGDPEAARDAYDRALAVDPACAPAHFNLALLYARDPDTSRQAIHEMRMHVAYGGSRAASARNMIGGLLDAGPAGETPPDTGHVPATAP
jgi:tetratricopeptide (TPR) repeat protein